MTIKAKFQFLTLLVAALVMCVIFVGQTTATPSDFQAESTLEASSLPNCSDRLAYADDPWVDGTRWCQETVIDDPSAGEMAFTALAAAPDGTLYATRPLAGEVLALTDSNGDGLPDSPRVVAEGLTLPNGLAYHDGALYISGGARIDRLTGEHLETLVDDLPAGGGFWTGGLTIGPDNRIYVGTGAPCDDCIPDNPARGAILSFALNGSDQQIVASGLRQPSDVAFVASTLWTVDTARDGLFDTPGLDELDRVTPGANFGWPFCIGADNHPDLAGAFDCGQVVAPALSLPTQSNPLGLAAYSGDALPSLTGALLMTLGGTHNQVDPRGTALVAVHFDDQGNPSGYEFLIPSDFYFDQFTLQQMNFRLSGFWPHRPFDVAVSAEGWVYVSSGGGRILALRPR